MGKSVFKIFAATFSIVGAVIGAGFITGGEASAFFLRDFSLSGVYCAAVLFVLFLFAVDDKFGKGLSFIVCFANVIVLSCMFSAVDELSVKIFRLSEKLKIFKILLAILTIFITSDGIKTLSGISCSLTPIVVLSILAVVAFVGVKNVEIPPEGIVGAYMPVAYVGANYLLIYPLAAKTCGHLSIKSKMLTALFSSLIIFSLTYFVGASLSGVSELTKMPLLTLSEKTPFSIPFKICCFCAVLTASLSSSYCVYSAFKKNERLKILSCLTALALSEVGFSVITDYLYPIIGVIGVILGAVNFSRIIFPPRRQARTSDLPERTILRCLPLRDRV